MRKVTVPGYPCVVISHTFDVSTDVFEFDTDEEASKALKEMYDDYLEEEIRNESDLNESECIYSAEEDYGQRVWEDGEKTFFVKTFTQKFV